MLQAAAAAASVIVREDKRQELGVEIKLTMACLGTLQQNNRLLIFLILVADQWQVKSTDNIYISSSKLTNMNFNLNQSIKQTNKGMECSCNTTRRPDTSIGLMKNLTILNLGHNLLISPIPDVIGLLVKLVIIDLSTNKITSSIPSSLGNLKQLYELDLYNNYLSNIPINIGNCKSMRTLVLQYNVLSGFIPTSIGLLTNLRLLGIVYN